jgi:hypothetical protein
MKRTLLILLVAGVAFALASLIVTRRQAARSAALLAEQQAAWQAEKAELEAALEQAREEARLASVSWPAAPAAKPSAPARLSPKEIMARLQALRLAPGTNPARTLRQAVYWFEELAQAGPAALPAIRDFLVRYEDLDLDTSWFQGRGSRDRLPSDFTLPPSLRFGLFDVVRQIGGTEAEKVLAEALSGTGRGVEVAYLTRVLQELAPDRYRDQALAAARSLLASTGSFVSASPLDRNHRDHLFSVLAFYGDAGYAGEAQTQLVRADSQLDRSALKYLQQTLGAQAVPIAAQAYQNPALTNSSAKEPLARLALNFVGLDTQANEFYQKSINDPLLTKDHRRNLIEDLNQDGFADTKNLTARDLPLVQNRIALIEQLAPSAMDDANAVAFKEAYKDLVNMRDRILQPPAPAAPR